MARILIVDDDEQDRLAVRTALEGTGHELLFASGGRAALKICEEEGDLDLVITDLGMPELNGLRLIKELMKLDPYGKVVAMSGRSKEQLILATDLGAVATLFKPIDPEKLLAVVARATEKGLSTAW